MVRSMMSHTDLPTSFWGYALETAAFTLNRVPSKSVQKTPHEMWTGKRPNMSFMKVWGCKAYVKHQMSIKLEHKSQKFTFVGYPKETKGYYFYNENKVIVARTGVFLKKNFSRTKEKKSGCTTGRIHTSKADQSGLLCTGLPTLYGGARAYTRMEQDRTGNNRSAYGNRVGRAGLSG
ncbi:hypothetical protein GQ457_04G021910 [Hibiscus cannabinus]